MKALSIVAIVLGLAALGASIFAKVEIHGNYKSLGEQIATEGPATAYDIPLLEEYKERLDLMHYIAWGAGGLALILGALAAAKSQKKGLPVVGIILGLAGAGLAFLSMP